MERQFKRHNRWDIAIHWFNTVCWLFLLFTGLALIKNADMAPLGQAYPDAVRAVFGGGAALLDVHVAVGVIWAIGFVAYIVFNPRRTLTFVKRIFSINPKRDIAWMLKKPAEMLFGEAKMKKMGLGELPPQGFYNMGQKVFGQAAVVGAIGLIVTGVIMAMSPTSLSAEAVPAVQWSILLHFLFAMLVSIGLLVHIYMAAIAPEERPALKSMFTGSVPESYAKHHHKLWYEDEVAEQKQS
jgi:formate dehydrogenase subunit gamma